MKDDLNRLESILTELVAQYDRTTSIGALLTMLVTIRLQSEGKQPTIGELARLTGIPRQSISRWIARHERKGWIRVLENPDDQRERRITAADPKLLALQLRKFQSIVQKALPGE